MTEKSQIHVSYCYSAHYGCFILLFYNLANIDHFVVRDDWTAYNALGTLRLHSNVKYKIDPKKKYQFSFIADDIPNVRSVFFINGRKYLCEKITATFTENGMSQLLKGNFYRII